MEQQEEQEDPDCEPPAPKKKKKKDKQKADQVNGQTPEATDLNGNSNGVEAPKKTEEDTEVGAATLYFAVYLLVKHSVLCSVSHVICCNEVPLAVLNFIA